MGGEECKDSKREKEGSDVNQSKVISYYDNEQCSCASHWLRTNSPERLTKPFNSYSPWHQWWLAAAARFSAVFWMISLETGSSNAPRKTIPPRCCQHVCSLRTRPWEWLLLIPQSVWLEAGWSNWSGPLFSPLAIISRCPLVDSCSLPLERGTDYLPLGPPEPLSH